MDAHFPPSDPLHTSIGADDWNASSDQPLAAHVVPFRSLLRALVRAIDIPFQK